MTAYNRQRLTVSDAAVISKSRRKEQLAGVWKRRARNYKRYYKKLQVKTN